MIHFAQNNDIIIGVDFGHGNDIAVKTTAKVHEDGRLEILKSERIGRTVGVGIYVVEQAVQLRVQQS